jgi:hypothetical protein
MSHATLRSVALALLATTLPAQENAKHLLRPITAPIRHAGVYHVGTGTWTRNASLANVTGPDVIYNNTCSSAGYFADQFGPPFYGGGAPFQHRSAVPSPSHPTVPSVYYPTGDDEAPGCHTSYVVNGFQFAYCTSATSSIDYQIAFANSYLSCGAADMVPDVTFDLTGLPGGTPSGAQNCWTVDVDLQAASLSFTLQGDGDGTYSGTAQQNQFGVWWKPLNPQSWTDSTGPVVAGNYTWTGGTRTGPLTPRRGTDGTIWDAPVDFAEPGTGMASNDFFRVGGIWAPIGGPGCYYFGGQPHADFFLKLFADPQCPPRSPMTSFCHPGEDGVRSCPCNNPPAASGRGCDNFGAHSGGAQLSAVGTAMLSYDTVVFTSSGENANSLSILLQGKTSVVGGAIFGAGVRCVASNLKRLYAASAIAGTLTRPGPGDPSVSQRSAVLGDSIGAGEHRFYGVYYRDPGASVPCGDPAKSFNITQSGDVIWRP